MLEQDALFDVDELARQEVRATPWHGVPLGYSTDYASLEALDDGLERYRAEVGDFGCIPRSHMWHRALTNPPLILDELGHELHVFHADAWCEIEEHDHSAEPLPGEYMTQVICPRCEWHHIDSCEQTCIEAWHDHAMPGWRDLPIVPQGTKNVAKWTQTAYPNPWRFQGAPVITQRAQHATRGVPGRSTFGGYDLCATTAT